MIRKVKNNDKKYKLRIMTYKFKTSRNYEIINLMKIMCQNYDTPS